ncbi:MAG TPA: hypothetical protein VID04_13710 [Methylomirabilota bacterium]
MIRLGGLRLFLVLWLLAVAGGQAWAHQVEPLAPEPGTAQPSPADPAMDLRSLLVLILPVALALRIRRPRRALALSLIVLIVTFAVEGARHSAHHAPGSESDCTVAAAAAHVPAAGATGIPADPVLVVTGKPDEAARLALVVGGPGLRRQRAPPAPLA